MITPVVDTTLFPYSAVVSIRAVFSDGRVSFGTGSLIGKNDVLTSTHLVYRPEYGGYASELWVYPGADFDASRSLLISSPFGGHLAGSVIAFPEEVYSDSNNNTNSLVEVASDLAIIGLSQAIGFQTGWFGLSSGVVGIQEAIAIGYPSDSTGMVFGNVFADSLNDLWISAYSVDGSALMGPGSSGGPLYILENHLPGIIGVKSSGNTFVNYWTDIDFKFDAIEAAIHSNDQLIGGSVFIDGTPRDNQFAGEMFNLVIDGLAGTDLVTYSSLSSQSIVTRTGGNVVTVVDALNRGQGDILMNIERLQFIDVNIALDVGPSQNAGSLYMLYQATFNRAPDGGGMGYWLAQIDDGKNLVDHIAPEFVNAPEFIAKYGINPTNAFYVDQLYLNVLGRPGEAGGVTFWNHELDTGKRSKAEVLVQFATLPEGASLVADLIANGIAYQEWVG